MLVTIYHECRIYCRIRCLIPYWIWLSSLVLLESDIPPREDLLGRTVNDLRIWEDPSDRAYLLTRLEEGGPIRNVITRLRTRSGEIKTTAYSADKIEFDGQTCILAVSEDVLQFDSQNAN